MWKSLQAHISTLEPIQNQFKQSEILMICHAGTQGRVDDEFLETQHKHPESKGIAARNVNPLISTL